MYCTKLTPRVLVIYLLYHPIYLKKILTPHSSPFRYKYIRWPIHRWYTYITETYIPDLWCIDPMCCLSIERIIPITSTVHDQFYSFKNIISSHTTLVLTISVTRWRIPRIGSQMASNGHPIKATNSNLDQVYLPVRIRNPTASNNATVGGSR